MADIHQFNKSASDTDGNDSEKKTSTSTRTTRRRYTSDEVADIIRISLQTESGNTSNTIDYEELLSIGKEMGVEEGQIGHAVHLLEEEQRTKDKERSLWVRFKAHCIIFAVVNVLCIGLNLISGDEVFWAGYMFFGWGLFLLGHYAGLRYAPEFVQMAMERTKLLANNKYQNFVEDDVNVSFTISDSSGLMESQGLAFVKEERLVIEYQNVDSILGLLKTGIKEVEIKFDDIALVKVEPKLWGSELVVKGRSLKALRNLPGCTAGVMRLKIARQSNTAALNLVDEILKKK